MLKTTDVTYDISDLLYMFLQSYVLGKDFQHMHQSPQIPPSISVRSPWEVDWCKIFREL